MEMQHAVGDVISSLRHHNVSGNTLVMFISDHGPQIELCSHGGSAGGLKVGKLTTWEGGVRVPAVAWWPEGIVEGGRVDGEVRSSLDVFATIMEITGGLVFLSWFFIMVIVYIMNNL